VLEPQLLCLFLTVFSKQLPKEPRSKELRSGSGSVKKLKYCARSCLGTKLIWLLGRITHQLVKVMTYYETSAIDENSLSPMFEHVFNSIVANIPNPPDPGMLLGKSISLGRRITNNPKFKTALFDTDSRYD
jgi:hypothetical protein